MTNQRAAVAAAPASGQARRSSVQTRRKRECHCEAPSTGTQCSACGGVVVQRHAAGGTAGDDPPEREADRAADAVTGGARVGRIGGLFTGLARVQRSAVYTRAPVGSSGRIQKGPLVDWDYVVYEDHVRLGNRVFDKKTKQVIGTWPWLTNNPGDITVDPKQAGKARSNLNRAYEWGAVPDKAASTGHIPLAIFPDGKTGAEALRKLYQEPDYRDKTLKGTIEVHLGNPESRVAGVDNPKDYLDRVKERARKLGVKEELLDKTLAELAAAGAMDAIIEGFGYAEGYENVGITYALEGRDKTDDKKIPQTVRNLRLFRTLPDKAPDEIQRLLGGKVPSNDGKAQKKAAHEEEDTDDTASLQDGVDESVARALRSPSEPLPVAVRRTMEARFGHDFGRVRIHTDGTARSSALQLGAHAYTVGRDIVFANGQYAPQTHAGQRLLAHELTHVVQQTNPGPAGPQAAVEAEAHAAGGDVLHGKPVSPVQAASRAAVHRATDGEPDGPPVAIAKENGTVAIVIMSGGKIAKGLAEIRPPKGTTAEEAARQIHFVRGGPSNKIDVVLPPGWGRQATNPKAKGMRLIDTEEQAREEKRAQAKEKVDRLRSEYEQYEEELLGSPGLPLYHVTVDEMLASKGFLEWRQRRARKRDFEDFARQSRADGWDDPELIKESWKIHRMDALEAEQKGQLDFQALKYDTVNALQKDFGEGLLLSWMASKPQPTATPSADGSTTPQYRVPLPDGSYATISEAECSKLKGEAWRKVETKLNSVQTQKDRYQYQRDNRNWAERGLDWTYGAKLEGKKYKDVDEKVAVGQQALKDGDLQAGLESLAAARKDVNVARREYEGYSHAQEIGTEVTITGLEVVKGAADLTLAIGTAPMGGWGLVLVTGKGVTETALVAAVQSTGERVDKGDVAFDIGLQVVTAAVTHGVAKVAPNSAIMNGIRKVSDKPIVGDALQAIVMDSAAHAVRMEYEAARGRGEHWGPDEAQKRFLAFVSDPNLLAREVVTAAAVRRLGPKVTSLSPEKGAPGKQTAPPAHEQDAAPSKAQGQEAAPARTQDEAPARSEPTKSAAEKPVEADMATAQAQQQPKPRPATAPTTGEAVKTPPPHTPAKGEPKVHVEASVPKEGPAARGAQDTTQETPVKKKGAGGHDVEVTKNSTKVCSPAPCPNLAVEYMGELKTDKRLVRELEDINKLRKTRPGAAADRAAALQTKLEQIRQRAQLPAPKNRLDPAIADEAAARIDAMGEPFELGVGKQRAQDIQEGKRDFVVDKLITFDIDEPLPVGDKSIKKQRQVARALDPYNRQLLDSPTNRATKGLAVDPRDIQRGRQRQPEVSMLQNPDALFTHRFGEVTELKGVFDQAVASIGNPETMKPTALKNEINGRMRGIIKTAQSGPGKVVRDVLNANGFQYGENVGFRAEGASSDLLPGSTDAPGADQVTSTMTVDDKPRVRIGTQGNKPAAEEAASPKSEHDAMVELEGQQLDEAKAEAEAAEAQKPKPPLTNKP